MGSRPSQFKKGGGFLDGVDSTITDYKFSDEFNGEPFVPGKMKDYKTGKPVDKPHSLNVLVSVRVDGATEDTTTTLKAANDFDAWEVSEDGHTLTPVEDGQELSGGTAFAKFIASLVKPVGGDEGFPEDRLPEDVINYEAIIGTRIRTVQQTDDERTKKFGQKKSKDGKKAYDRKDLVVETVYELPTAAGKANGKSAKPGKPASKAVGRLAGKTASATKEAPAAEDVDIKTFAGETLLGILKKNKGPLLKVKLSMQVVKAIMADPRREDVKKYLFSDDHLAEYAEEGIAEGDELYTIVFDKAKQTIEAVA